MKFLNRKVYMFLAVMLCCSVFLLPTRVEAAEPDELPMLPTDVYGHHYFLYHTDNNNDDDSDDCYYLYIINGDPGTLSTYVSSSGDDMLYINSSYSLHYYIYSSSNGWVYSCTSGGSFKFIDNWTIVSSTLDVRDKDTDELVFAANASVLTETSLKLDKIGNLLLGSVGLFDSSLLGVFPFCCMVGGAVFELIYRMSKRRF